MPPAIEQVVVEGTFSVEKFVESFDVLVEAAGAPVSLRQMILSMALTGRLTQQSIEDGPVNGLRSEEADSVASLGMRPLPIPGTWTYGQVGQLADCVLGKMLDKAKHTKGTKHPYLRNTNVRWFGFDLTDLLEMYFEDDSAGKLWISSRLFRNWVAAG